MPLIAGFGMLIHTKSRRTLKKAKIFLYLLFFRIKIASKKRSTLLYGSMKFFMDSGTVSVSVSFFDGTYACC